MHIPIPVPPLDRVYNRHRNAQRANFLSPLIVSDGQVTMEDRTLAVLYTY